MNDVFVIRHRTTQTVGGVLTGITDSGNFDYCYEDENVAKKAMLDALDSTEDFGNVEDCHTTDDYAVLVTKDGTKYEWWIDKIGVVRAGDR